MLVFVQFTMYWWLFKVPLGWGNVRTHITKEFASMMAWNIWKFLLYLYRSFLMAQLLNYSWHWFSWSYALASAIMHERHNNLFITQFMCIDCNCTSISMCIHVYHTWMHPVRCGALIESVTVHVIVPCPSPPTCTHVRSSRPSRTPSIRITQRWPLWSSLVTSLVLTQRSTCPLLSPWQTQPHFSETQWNSLKKWANGGNREKENIE